MTAFAVVPVVVFAAAALVRALARARWRRPVHGRAGSTTVPAWFARRATHADVPVDQAWRAWRVAALAAVAGVLALPPALAVLIVAAVAATPFAAAGPLRRRAERAFDVALPSALDVVARSLRSGASLRQALADAAEAVPGALGSDLRLVVRMTAAGIPLAEALDAWGRRCPRPGVLLAVAALGLAVETGGASAKAVDGVAATLRRRLAVQEEAQSLSAQARASAAVLAGAPLVVCAFTLASGGAAARFLLQTPAGLACLLAGLSLDGLGGWWMARLTQGRAR